MNSLARTGAENDEQRVDVANVSAKKKMSCNPVKVDVAVPIQLLVSVNAGTSGGSCVPACGISEIVSKIRDSVTSLPPSCHPTSPLLLPLAGTLGND